MNRASTWRGLLTWLAACMAASLPATARAAGVVVTPASLEAVVLRVDPRAAAPAAAATALDASLLRAADRLQYQHRYAEAEGLVSRHLAQRPDDAGALVLRAQLRLQQGHTREAMADCLRATPALSALTASACQAQAMAGLGAAPRARQLMESALQRANASASPQELAWGQGIAAELAARAGDHAAADRWYRAALAANAGGHFPRIAYAEYLLARQRHREVLGLLAGAPDDVSVMRLRRLALAAGAVP